MSLQLRRLAVCNLEIGRPRSQAHGSSHMSFRTLITNGVNFNKKGFKTKELEISINLIKEK